MVNARAIIARPQPEFDEDPWEIIAIYAAHDLTPAEVERGCRTTLEWWREYLEESAGDPADLLGDLPDTPYIYFEGDLWARETFNGDITEYDAGFDPVRVVGLTAEQLNAMWPAPTPKKDGTE